MSTVTPVPAGTSATETFRCVAVGALVSLVAAGLWVVFVEVSHYKLGLVATGIGLLVGIAMARTATTNRSLPMIGALLALLGCLVGDFLSDASEAGRAFGIGTLTIVEKSVQHPDAGLELFKIGFAPMDVLFWALATYAAFRQILAGVAGAVARQQQAAVVTAPVNGLPAAAGTSSAIGVPDAVGVSAPAGAAADAVGAAAAAGTVPVAGDGVATTGDGSPAAGDPEADPAPA